MQYDEYFAGGPRGAICSLSMASHSKYRIHAISALHSHPKRYVCQQTKRKSFRIRSKRSGNGLSPKQANWWLTNEFISTLVSNKTRRKSRTNLRIQTSRLQTENLKGHSMLYRFVCFYSLEATSGRSFILIRTTG